MISSVSKNNNTSISQKQLTTCDLCVPSVISCVSSVNQLYHANASKDPVKTTLKLYETPIAMGYTASVLGMFIAKIKCLEIFLTLTFIGSFLGIIIAGIDQIIQSNELIDKKNLKDKLHTSWVKKINQIAKNDNTVMQLEEFNTFLKRKETKEILGNAYPRILDHFEKILYSVELSPKTNHYLLDLFVSDIKKTFFQQRLEKLNKIFNESLPVQKQEKKQRLLAHKITPIIFNELKEKIPTLLQGLSNSDEGAIEASEKLFKEIDTQLIKAMTIHILGIITLSTFILSFAFVIASLPPLVPLILAGVALALSISHYVLRHGLLQTKGWHFTSNYLLPDFFHAHKPQSLPA